MNRKLGLSLSLLTLLLASSACLPSSSTTTVKGYVFNYDSPVSGATVTFGGTGSKATATTNADGKFTITATHRPTEVLRLEVVADGYGQKEKVEFPGFAAPTGELKIEMLKTIAPSRR
jgi:hypothetical protein